MWVAVRRHVLACVTPRVLARGAFQSRIEGALLARAEQLAAELAKLEARMQDPAAAAALSGAETRAFGKELSRLAPVAEGLSSWKRLRSQLADAQEIERTEGDADMRELAREEMCVRVLRVRMCTFSRAHVCARAQRFARAHAHGGGERA